MLKFESKDKKTKQNKKKNTDVLVQRISSRKTAGIPV